MNKILSMERFQVSQSDIDQWVLDYNRNARLGDVQERQLFLYQLVLKSHDGFEVFDRFVSQVARKRGILKYFVAVDVIATLKEYSRNRRRYVISDVIAPLLCDFIEYDQVAARKEKRDVFALDCHRSVIASLFDCVQEKKMRKDIHELLNFVYRDHYNIFVPVLQDPTYFYSFELPVTSHPSHAQIYRGYSAFDGSDIVVKRITNPFMRTSRKFHEFQAMVEKEINQMKDLLNVGMIGICSVKQPVEPLNMVVLERFDGDLFQYYNAGGKYKKINLEEARYICHTIVNILSSLQKKGLYHHDVRPTKFLYKKMNPCVLIKICSLGMYTPMYPDYTHSRYKAPEGDSETDALYSVGVILYEMVIGSEFPHDFDTSNNLKNERLDSELKSFLIRLLDPNPLTRLSWDEIKSHPFYQIGTHFQDTGRKEMQNLRGKAVDLREENLMLKKLLKKARNGMLTEEDIETIENLQHGQIF
eukprot:TRINITY_DN833_c0_g1_i1.p1 TRINITY_DN833_c0_g1~~TRINITY_DN833_c0_g1_i1.p1  ORF type:complete len:473 (-),score=83.23 TRINITY_DN833_c0_g1_i1:2217-3635(-)